MKYILTLNSITPEHTDEVGFRAFDLAILKEKRMNIPLTFVINNLAFQEFLAANSLRQKIDALLKEKRPVEAYSEILLAFSKAQYPKDLEAELVEAYESLAIEPGVSAKNMLSSLEAPCVSIIRSPNYALPVEDAEGQVQDVKSAHTLLNNLKLVFATMYSPESIEFRNKSGISDGFNTGIIVQKSKPLTASAIVYSISGVDEHRILVRSFLGLPDFGLDEEILGKDIHEVDANQLSIVSAERNVQEYQISHDVETGDLIKENLHGAGGGQKINEKDICEIARLAKRAKSFIGRNVKMLFGVKDNYIYALQINRMPQIERKVFEEHETADVGIDEETGARTVRKTTTIIGAVESKDDDADFKLPEILSTDEVKKQLMESEPQIKDEASPDGSDAEADPVGVSDEIETAETDADLDGDEKADAVAIGCAPQEKMLGNLEAYADEPQEHKLEVYHDDAEEKPDLVSSDGSDNISRSVKAEFISNLKIVGDDIMLVPAAKEDALPDLDLAEKKQTVSALLNKDIFSDPGKEINSIPESKIRKERNLLEEVLRIKEALEKLEESALSNNKETYDKESRVLEELMRKARES